jgi:hypothetical protein
VEVPVNSVPEKRESVRGTVPADPTVIRSQLSGGRRLGLARSPTAMRWTVCPSEIHAQILLAKIAADRTL